MTRSAFHRLAAKEAHAAEARYRHANPAVAERFQEAVTHARRRIEANPDSFAVIGRHYRQVRVERFPYTLIYRWSPDEELIVIVAAAHTSRRPGYWRRRR